MDITPTPAPPVICHILPPYLLERLAEHGDPEVREAVAHTMLVDTQLREQREVFTERGRGLQPGRGAGWTRTLPETATAPTPPAKPKPSAKVAVVRSIHDAENTATLPGTSVRAEGAPAGSDTAVNQAYDGLGDTWDLFHAAYGRNSLDDRGMALIASVHYERNYDNAFWNGEQMVFGDGDGRIFTGFTQCIDVIGHELTHGVTQFTAGLTYVGQSGALNESVSDVFGSLVKQRVAGQSADRADWLIGAGLFTPAVKGVALRSMKAPGTAYDDPQLGKDPQPSTMSGYVKLPHNSQNDNGGVHTNSGIPNHAFYLAAVAIGGNAWEGAGAVWYDVLTGTGVTKDVDFAGFAELTVEAAAARFGAGSAQRNAVADAWHAVEVLG